MAQLTTLFQQQALEQRKDMEGLKSMIDKVNAVTEREMQQVRKDMPKMGDALDRRVAALEARTKEQSPPRKQHKGEGTPEEMDADGKEASAKVASSSVSGAAGPIFGSGRGGFVAHAAPAEKTDINPKVLWIKGFEKAYIAVYVPKHVDEFMAKGGIVGASHDIRDGQQSVKLTFLNAAAADTAMQTYLTKRVELQLPLRLTRDKTPAQRAFGRRVGIARAYVEKRLRGVEGVWCRRGRACSSKGTVTSSCRWCASATRRSRCSRVSPASRATRAPSSKPHSRSS